MKDLELIAELETLRRALSKAEAKLEKIEEALDS
jgi:hypothetical protein